MDSSAVRTSLGEFGESDFKKLLISAVFSTDYLVRFILRKNGVNLFGTKTQYLMDEGKEIKQYI